MKGGPAPDPFALEPVLAVTGYSGSGKTTLLEQAISRLVARGLTVGAVKHDAHGLQVDHPGKDSDRLFRAGARVVVRGPDETLIRLPAGAGTSLEAALDALLAWCDLVLVEGHKGSPLAKVWLTRGPEDPPPPGSENVIRELGPGGDRSRAFLEIVEDLLLRSWRSRPRFGGILVGGSSRRMGRPKQLLPWRGRTLARIVHDALAPHVERVVLLGEGEVEPELAGLPRLPDPPGTAGPMAGLAAALRWAPRAAWVVAACDMPELTGDAVAWLLSRRAPGARAVLPLDEAGRPEPLLAVHEPHARGPLEELLARGVRAPRHLRDVPGVATPRIPAGLARAWLNVNQPEDLPG